MPSGAGRVTVERIDLTVADQIVAVCRRGAKRQRIPILDLPLSPAAARGRRVDRGVQTLGPGCLGRPFSQSPQGQLPG